MVANYQVRQGVGAVLMAVGVGQVTVDVWTCGQHGHAQDCAVLFSNSCVQPVR